jgi:guanosine-3',5'-bis(diphosphate) 3'-pyrophosphohydrolase
MIEGTDTLESTLEKIRGDVGEYLEKKYANGDRQSVLQRWAAAAEAARSIAHDVPPPRQLNAVLHATKTAQILKECGLDVGCMTAALLHQYPKELSIPLEDLLKQHGHWQDLFPSITLEEEIELIAKVGEVRVAIDSFFPGRSEAQAEEMVNKIASIVSVDPRPFLVLLASRLERLETLGQEKWERSKTGVAQETFLLFVPVSHFLRMDTLTRRFEDTLFRLANEKDYNRFKDWIGYEYDDLVERLGNIASNLYAHLGNHATTVGYSLVGFESRVKHLHSAYMAFLKRRADKRLRRSLPKAKEELDRETPIDDLLGVRIIVQTKKQCDDIRLVCHQALHDMGFRPYRYDDRYKYNRGSSYNAIHDRFEVEKRLILEIQIREQQQHWDAEMGPRAHWIYKFKQSPEIFGTDRILNVLWEHWFQTLAPLFDKNVFVMTDVGTIAVMKKGCTALDLACKLKLLNSHNYNIKATLIKSPGELWPGQALERKIEVSERLLTNQSLRLQATTPAMHYPDIGWLDCVACDDTRNFLVARLCTTQAGQAQVKNWALKELKQQISNLPTFWQNLGLMNGPDDVIQYLVNVSHSHENEGDALLSLAKGGASEVSRALISLQKHNIAKFRALYRTHRKKKLAAFKTALEDDKAKNILMMSERNHLHEWQGMIRLHQETKSASSSFLSVTFCICCCPLPGDQIVGMPCSGDEGDVLLVHRLGCPVYSNVGSSLKLLWNDATLREGKVFSVGIEIAGFDRLGFAQDVSHVFVSEDVLIHDYHVIDLNTFAKIHKTGLAIFDLGVELATKEQLHRILRKLRKIDVVVDAQRSMYPPDYVPTWKQIRC